MSKIGLAIVLILIAGRSYAQQDYFVLVQADNNQPFYARMGGKLFSSSAQGHLILSQLKEGAYNIIIGFPKQLFPEQQFSFTLPKKDLEFQLKDLGEKGWGLFNPQTLELKMPDENKGNEPKNHLEGIKKDDAFSRLMAGVVSDTAVMYNTYAPQEVTPANASSAPGKDDSVAGTIINSSVGEATGIGTRRPDTVSLAGRADTAVIANGRVDTAVIAAGKEDIAKAAPGKEDTAQAASFKDTSASVSMAAPSGSVPLYRPVPADSSLSSRQAALPKKEDSAVIDSMVHKTDPSVITGSNVDTAVSGNPAVGGTASPGAAPVIPGPASASPPLAVAAPPLHKAGLVVKLSERKTPKGTRLVYTDHIQGRKADTIVVIIPVDTGSSVSSRTGPEAPGLISDGSGSPTPASAIPARPATSETGQGVPAPKLSPEALAQKMPPREAVTARRDSAQKKASALSLFINSDCKSFATEYDVDKLRVKMLESGKDEDRLLAARKVFKTKCFSTRQIKALSEIFTSDAQKYRFFEIAYPFVSDDHFKELSDLLADPVYNNKFKAMISH